MVFDKSLLVSTILLSIFADLVTTVVWMGMISPLDSNRSSLFPSTCGLFQVHLQKLISPSLIIIIIVFVVVVVIKKLLSW